MNDNSTYHRPSTLKTALSILQKYNDISVIAGGTDLIVKKIRHGDSRLKLLDITAIPELFRIVNRSNFLSIGSSVTISDISQNKLIIKKFPALVKAASSVGSKQIRSIATIGGNIANASPAGDLIPPLFVYKADLVLTSKREQRIINIDDFFLGNAKTVLEKNELITEILLPLNKHNSFSVKSNFKKIGQRRANAISKVNCAIKLVLMGSKIIDAAIAFGSVAERVIFAEKTPGELINKKLSKELIIAKSSDIISDIRPIDDIRSSVYYRRMAAKALFIEIMSDFL